MLQNKTKAKVAAQNSGTSFIDKIWDFFTSLKLTIFLLLTLSVISIAGTVIQQNRPVQEYYRFFRPETVEIFNKLGLLDMYHSWWFILCLAAMGLNIVACTMNRYPLIMKGIKKQNFILDETLEKSLTPLSKIKFSIPLELAEKKVVELVERSFKTRPVVTVNENAKHLFFEKGKYTRLSFFFTHLSLLVIFTGALIGSIFGFKGYATIIEGETISSFETRQGGNKKLNFSVKCNDFTVNFYPNGTPKDYKSDLSIIKDGKEVVRQIVRVNDPITYEGITFYQSSYGGLPDVTLEVLSNNGKSNGNIFVPYGKTVTLFDGKTKVEVANYKEDFHTPDGMELGRAIGVNIYAEGKEPSGVWLLESYPELDKRRNYEFYFKVKDVKLKEYTGLQVNKDPGVWIVWTGCFMLVFGIMMAFFTSHKKIWVKIITDKKERVEVTIGGMANKNRYAFEKELEQVINGFKEVK